MWQYDPGMATPDRERDSLSPPGGLLARRVGNVARSMLFLLMVLVGLIGLGLTRVVGTGAKRGSPSATTPLAAPTTRADG
jgi:hypothetical protein